MPEGQCIKCGYRFSASDKPVQIIVSGKAVDGVPTTYEGPAHRDCVRDIADHADIDPEKLLEEADEV